MKHLPIIAIVGEPNVGKSSLLNKIAGGKRAVTSNVPGTTRDRHYLDTTWNGVDFTMVDTAGLTFGTGDNKIKGADELENALREQIDIAVDEADMIILVVDGKLPPNAIERRALLKFRKLKKPALLLVNKVDSAKQELERLEAFRALGVKPIFAVSAVAGRGLGDALDYISDYLKKHGLDKQTEPAAIGIAVSIVGKPNVGKSSIFNKIVKQDRVVVSPIPGTTRTAIDTVIEFKGEPYTFIDTAGLKRKSYRQEQPDVFGGFQTYHAIRRSDVCLMIIDASEPLTKQDQHIAQEIFTLHKGLILVANKMDQYRGTEEALRDYISLHFPFTWMSPLFFISAKTGQGLNEVMEAIKPIFENRHKTVDEEHLNNLFEKTVKHNGPKRLRDQKIPKVFGVRQTDINPPTFELLVNHPAAISQQYRKYLEKNLIKNLDFWGTPIILRLKGKDKK